MCNKKDKAIAKAVALFFYKNNGVLMVYSTLLFAFYMV